MKFYRRLRLMFGVPFMFKDPSTGLMENIIELHHIIVFFLIFIALLVSWLLLQVIDNFIVLQDIVPISSRRHNSNTLTQKEYFRFKLRNKVFFVFAYISALIALKRLNFNENKFLEGCWTFFPAVILITISIPSFYILYLSEETIATHLTVKAIGYQWYWSYDYTDLFNCWFQMKVGKLDIDDYIIESYMEPVEYLNFSKGDFRLLETENILILPTNLHLRLIVTSMDTLHSFALPSLGIKVDAIPGRLNRIDLFLYRMGVFYGQCSEICGIGHGFMPICLYAISYLNFLIGDL